MRLLTAFILCLFLASGFAQNAATKTVEFQQSQNQKYKKKKTSPLDSDDRRKFKAFNFYPFDEKYVVQANFEKLDSLVLIEMKTSTDRIPIYRLYGIAEFELDGGLHQLQLYQYYNKDKEKYGDQLFLPFRDETSGQGSYGGGRYIDLDIPEGDDIVINFHLSYNPYCAYSARYSCPVPPEENDLKVSIPAGIKYKYTKK